jgi:hypothetical protein
MKESVTHTPRIDSADAAGASDIGHGESRLLDKIRRELRREECPRLHGLFTTLRRSDFGVERDMAVSPEAHILQRVDVAVLPRNVPDRS